MRKRNGRSAIGVERHEQDAVLVGRCLEGDREAWGLLLTRHRPLIFAVARRCGLRPDDAEEMYQEVCLTLLERLDVLRDHRSLAAWVATTTARKCWRKRRASTALPLNPSEDARGLDESLADAAPLPEQVFLESSEREAVRQALEELGDPCALLLRLLFVEDQPYETAAERLGVAVGSIGVYRRRCLRRLGDRLRADGWLAPGGSAP